MSGTWNGQEAFTHSENDGLIATFDHRNSAQAISAKMNKVRPLSAPVGALCSKQTLDFIFFEPFSPNGDTLDYVAVAFLDRLKLG